MVCIVNEKDCLPESFGNRATRRRLLTQERVPGVRVFVDRVSVAAQGEWKLSVPPGSLGWFQVLSGSFSMKHGGATDALSDVHVALLPSQFEGQCVTSSGAEVLYAEVPQAVSFDPDIRSKPPVLKIVDWSREPVLDSKHDARKRIYVATPKLTGTKALKAEIIIYPEHTTGSNHHHEGAEHFMYVIRGTTTAYSNEKEHQYTAGDLVYHPDGERHYSSTGKEGLTFVEFFVPAEYKTVWTDENKICTWLPTGKDSKGGVPSRQIRAHDSLSAGVSTPADL